MILTINANASLDRILFIPYFMPGIDMRPEKSMLAVGGKGFDTALVLQTLGAEVESIGFVAGQNGQVLARLLEEHGIPVEWLWLAGETRIAHVIVETERNRHSHITTRGYSVTPADCALFLQRMRQKAACAVWGVLAGSLPEGAPETFYRECIATLHEVGVPVLIDTAGKPMLSSLSSRPEIVKMNQAEYQQTFGESPVTPADWIAACRAQIQTHALQTFVLTCGKEGLLLFTSEGDFHVQPPVLAAVNAAGSGDAVSAALVYHRSLGESWESAARWAAAAGAAVVLTEATAVCSMDDILRILPQVQITRLPQP